MRAGRGVRARRRELRDRVQRRRIAGETTVRAGDSASGVLFDDPVHDWEVREWRAGGPTAAVLRWRVHADPFMALADLTAVRDEALGVLERQLVELLRRQAYSWDDIGFALGMTGEAARKRVARWEQDAAAKLARDLVARARREPPAAGPREGRLP